jgi:hypothetical protein
MTVLYTSIKPQILKKSLFIGSSFSITGAFCIVLSGAWLSMDTLQTYGIWILLTSFIVMSLGLLPFRRLKKLSQNPDHIQIHEEYFTVYSQEKKILSIPFNAIQELEYAEYKKRYGMSIFFKDALKEKICIHCRDFDMKSIQKKSRQEWGCSIFLPFYSERSCCKLLNIINQK